MGYVIVPKECILKSISTQISFQYQLRRFCLKNFTVVDFLDLDGHPLFFTELLILNLSTWDVGPTSFVEHQNGRNGRKMYTGPKRGRVSFHVFFFGNWRNFSKSLLFCKNIASFLKKWLIWASNHEFLQADFR